jgi:hypothetical protein
MLEESEEVAPKVLHAAGTPRRTGKLRTDGGRFLDVYRSSEAEMSEKEVNRKIVGR